MLTSKFAGTFGDKMSEDKELDFEVEICVETANAMGYLALISVIVMQIPHDKLAWTGNMAAESRQM